MTVADGSGEGGSPAVEKFRRRGVGAGMNWRGTVVLAVVVVPARAFAPVCVAPVEVPLEPLSPAAAPVIPTAWLLIPVCAPAFVPGCVPTVCVALVELPVVAPACLLPLVPIRGVCARLNGTVATQITITPSLIDVIWVILFSLRPSRALFGRRIFIP